MIRQYYNSVFGAPVPHSCLPCVHFATARSVKPHCQALGVRLPSMVHSSHDGSVSQLQALFWHHLYFSPHITKQPCVQLQRNALISVSGEAALHFSTGGLASLNNLPRNEYFPMKYFSGITSRCQDLDQFRFSGTGRGSPANTGEGEAIAGLPCWVTSWHRTCSTVIQLHAKH